MAKTEFQNGTIVEPAWLNAVFLNGHKHDGADQDGHCDKIVLADETDGNLPISRVEGDLSIDRVVGELPQTRITGYSFGTFEIDVYPFLNVPIFWKKVSLPGINSPVIVTLIFPHREGELNPPPVGNQILQSIGMDKQTIPAELRPNTDIYRPVTVINDITLLQPGAIQITGTGLISFWALRLDEGMSRPYHDHNFVVGRSGGFYAFTVTYPIFFE
jgi:hypothetical protein